MKILLVDDSSSQAIIVGQMIEQLGHFYVHAINGKHAIDLVQSERFDLILLDWNMPIMTGIEFLQLNFESAMVDCPIVMMTAENKPEYIKQALKFGASEYIMKPFTQDILLSKIERVLDSAA
jgi:two-component system chemotaxis response regulator CheY